MFSSADLLMKLFVVYYYNGEYYITVLIHTVSVDIYIYVLFFFILLQYHVHLEILLVSCVIGTPGLRSTRTTNGQSSQILVHMDVFFCCM